MDLSLGADDAGRSFALALFDVSAIGDGFSQLRFRLERLGVLIGEEVLFDDLASAQAFFEDALFEVRIADPAGSDAPGLRAVFEITQAQGDAFGMSLAFATTVPEPSTVILLSFGLLWLGLGHRDRPRHRS